MSGSTLTQLESRGNGAWSIAGPMVLESVPELLRSTAQIFAGGSAGGAVTIDLGAVQRFDSSALALLVEWRRTAQRTGMAFSVQNLPAPLRAIASLCGVEEFLAPVTAR